MSVNVGSSTGQLVDAVLTRSELLHQTLLRCKEQARCFTAEEGPTPKGAEPVTVRRRHRPALYTERPRPPESPAVDELRQRVARLALQNEQRRDQLQRVSSVAPQRRPLMAVPNHRPVTVESDSAQLRALERQLHRTRAETAQLRLVASQLQVRLRQGDATAPKKS